MTVHDSVLGRRSCGKWTFSDVEGKCREGKCSVALWLGFSLSVQSGPTLCDPMDCSTPVFPVHHQLSELAQTRVHRVGDAIQPSHPLSPPSPPALSPSKHQGLFQSLCIRWPKYWPGDLPDPGIEPTFLMFLRLAGRFFNTSTTSCFSTPT